MRFGRLHFAAVIMVLLGWSAVVAAAQQAVVFDNFGPNNTYSNGGTWMGSGFDEVMFYPDGGWNDHAV